MQSRWPSEGNWGLSHLFEWCSSSLVCFALLSHTEAGGDPRPDGQQQLCVCLWREPKAVFPVMRWMTEAGPGAQLHHFRCLNLVELAMSPWILTQLPVGQIFKELFSKQHMNGTADFSKYPTCHWISEPGRGLGGFSVLCLGGICKNLTVNRSPSQCQEHRRERAVWCLVTGKKWRHGWRVRRERNRCKTDK